MTIKYVGTKANNEIGGGCANKRFAEFTYSDKEAARFEKIIENLEMNGYSVDCGIENWAAIEVADKSEYDQVAECYKAAKRVIK